MTHKKPYGANSKQFWSEKKSLESWTSADRNEMREVLENRRQNQNQNPSESPNPHAQQLCLFETLENVKSKREKRSLQAARVAMFLE